MKNTLLTMALIFANCGMFSLAIAADDTSCLECHEPAEDWQGMSAAEVLVVAMDPDVKLHEDNQKLNEEELKAIIAKLLAAAQ